MPKWIRWIRDQVREFFRDEDAFASLQDLVAENRRLAARNEEQQDERVALNAHIAELRQSLERSEAEHEAARIEIANIRDDLARARSQGESLVTVKKVWDALSRLEHDLGAARGAIAESKRSIGQAFEKAELLRN